MKIDIFSTTFLANKCHPSYQYKHTELMERFKNAKCFNCIKNILYLHKKFLIKKPRRRVIHLQESHF